MAGRSINVFLNAFDNTAQATASAAANVASYADSVVASNAVAESSYASVADAASASFIGMAASATASLAPVLLSIGAIAAAGYAIYKSWDVLGPLFVSVGQAITSALGATWDSIRSFLESVIGGSLNWTNVMQAVIRAGVAGLAPLAPLRNG